jgi:hypothetical protein
MVERKLNRNPPLEAFVSVRILRIFSREDPFTLNALKGKSFSFSSHLRYNPSESK